MNSLDFLALSPLIALAGSAVIILVVAALYRSHLLTVGLTVLGLLAALFLLWPADTVAPRQVTPILLIDGYALFYMGLLFIASLVVVVLASGYLAARGSRPEEFYVLVLLATLGAATLVASSHFASFFIGLEVLSVSLYALIAYLRWRREGIEGGLKYLVLAGVSSAFLLFGMALIYADQGTMSFGQLATLLAGSRALSILLPVGLAMIVIGVGFKLALVPFHMWAPDVYEGATAPATAFLATVSKGGMFALLLRFFRGTDFQAHGVLLIILIILSIASILTGNVLALLQNNLKRVLAYSSIAHLGYLLVALMAGGTLGVTAATFYLTTYFAANLGALGVITVLSGEEHDADTPGDYRGLFWRRPWAAAVLTVALLSLAGLPLTAGFVGKFYLVTAGISVALWLPSIVLVVGSAIGLYYYLRIVVAMYLPPAAEGEVRPVTSRLSTAGGVVLGALLLVLLWLGVYPAPLLAVIQNMTGR